MSILKIGEKCPVFEAKNQNGETVRSSDLIGKKTILFFYPKDNTPGCTKEACNLRDNYSTLLNEGFIIYGISIDSEKSHNRFIEKQELPFDLLVDEEKTLVEAFGVWQEKKNYGKTYMGTVRTTFIINEEGVISNVIEKVKTNDHANQILNA